MIGKSVIASTHGRWWCSAAFCATGPLLAACMALAPIIAAQTRADRSQPPALEPTPKLNLGPIQQNRLSNGLSVWLLEAHEVPLVQVNLLVRAGGGDDPRGKFGVASLTANMLDEGAGGRTALQIADDVDFLGATLQIISSFDATSLRLNVPVSTLGDALPTLANVALRPTFPADELERVRQETLTGFLQKRDNPADIASLAFARSVFGLHRYGADLAGTDETLKAITADDLRAFHETAYAPSRATLIVVGDITIDAVAPLLEAQFGRWADRDGSTRPSVPAAPQLTKRQITIVNKPGAEQSQIRIGSVGVARNTPDYFTLQVMNTILGGSFTSRLNQNLREQHGYSYGARSLFDMRLAAGPFWAGAGVQTDKTAEALVEFFNEFAAIRKQVSDEELHRGRNFVALSLASQLETIDDLSSRIEELVTYALPANYYNTFVDNVEATTRDSVRRAADLHMRPERFSVVVVGDQKLIESKIRALNIAPVKVVSIAEALGVSEPSTP
jgi:zinc protease